MSGSFSPRWRPGDVLGFGRGGHRHHARLEQVVLRRAVDRDKDQSHVLAVLIAEQLRHALFPIGDAPAGDPREAAARGLVTAKSRTAMTSASSRPVTPRPSSAPVSA